MNDCRFHPCLGRYHDDELDAQTRRLVEVHVEICPPCAAELGEMRELSARIQRMSGEVLGEVEDSELARMHEAVERAAGEERTWRPLLRTASMLGALAASVLIVGGAWLAEIGPVGREIAGTGVPSAALAPEWERVATTLRADPRPGFMDDSLFSPRYAAAVDWMLSTLTPTEPKPWSKRDSL
jgi:anti-sigma factor RsiW